MAGFSTKITTEMDMSAVPESAQNTDYGSTSFSDGPKEAQNVDLWLEIQRIFRQKYACRRPQKWPSTRLEADILVKTRK